GHNGAKALDELAADAVGFEGNAQTLRILTRLESKTFDAAGESVGLNLSRATLAACVKYPWTRDERRGGTKFGVYRDDVPVFTWLREGVPQHQRSIEAQVMDLSDDIAYSVHDVEDGVGGGFSLQADHSSFAPITRAAREWYDPDVSADRLERALERLMSTPQWPQRPFDGSRRSRAELKSLTSALIGRFVTAARAATLDVAGCGPLVLYDGHSHVTRPTRRGV